MTDQPRPRPMPEDFLAQIMTSPLEFTSQQVADAAGVDLDITRRMWRALGFADVGDERVFTQADIDALKAIMRLIKKGILNFEEAIDIARGIGQSTARLAEWQTEVIGRSMQSRGMVETVGILPRDELDDIMKESRQLKPVLERLLIYSWRRQMAASAARATAVADSGDDLNDELTVGFADIVGFTRLARQLPDDDFTALVEDFEATSTETVAATGGRVVKSLGDEILFVDADVDVIAETAIRLHEHLRERKDFPKIRVGLATGPVVQRMGDVFGITVNRASRLTTMAKPAATYIDADTMAQLESSGSTFDFQAVRPRRARGFGLMRAWSLTRGE